MKKNDGNTFTAYILDHNYKPAGKPSLVVSDTIRNQINTNNGVNQIQNPTSTNPTNPAINPVSNQAINPGGIPIAKPTN